tara:strand:- start:46 stop:825 length:780 start_codon:yes stop_codon:yes gene_type:complete
MSKIHFITICASNKLETPSPAIDLYKGGYWGIVKEISKLVDYTWILSAKYGVISSQQVIEPYKLSFKPDSPDYIGHKGLKPRAYWDAINCYNGDSSITNLINRYPKDKFVMYASFSYMKAIKNDILPSINNPNLYIFSPDTKGKEFTPHILKTSLKAKAILGGNKITITSLTIKHFLENISEIGWDKTNINSYFKNMVKDQPEYNYNPPKQKVEDNFIKKMILDIGINTPKTTLLKTISKKGYACGPNRFHRILNDLKS